MGGTCASAVTSAEAKLFSAIDDSPTDCEPNAIAPNPVVNDPCRYFDWERYKDEVGSNQRAALFNMGAAELTVAGAGILAFVGFYFTRSKLYLAAAGTMGALFAMIFLARAVRYQGIAADMIRNNAVCANRAYRKELEAELVKDRGNSAAPAPAQP